MKAYYRIGAIANADLVVFPEMTITGYPPEDLLINAQFQERAVQVIKECAQMSDNGPAMLFGGLWRENDVLYNTVFLADHGKIIARQFKNRLPN